MFCPLARWSGENRPRRSAGEEPLGDTDTGEEPECLQAGSGRRAFLVLAARWPVYGEDHRACCRAGAYSRSAGQIRHIGTGACTRLRPPMPRIRRKPLLLCLLLSGCFSTDSGVEAPLERIYFPVGVALSDAGDRLFVAKSDFDLQFNSGTLQLYDAAALRALLPRYCDDDSACNTGETCDNRSLDGEAPTYWCVEPASGATPLDVCARAMPSLSARRGENLLNLSTQSPSALLNQPGRCGPIDAGQYDLRVDTVRIGAFVSDLIVVPRSDGTGTTDAGSQSSGDVRLLMPVRGDATLHWVDVNDGARGKGELDCGQDPSSRVCDANHRRGDDSATENSRGVELPSEPFAVAASSDGDRILVTHQASGQLSLFTGGASPSGPRLQYVLSDLPAGAVAIAAVPEPELTSAGNSGNDSFLVSYRNLSTISLVRFFDDAPPAGSAGENRPYVSRTAQITIRANARGTDSRGLAVDPSDRQGCEASCTAGDIPCLTERAAIPLDIYASNRNPDTLLIGETRGSLNEALTDDLPRFDQVQSLQAGPSKVVVGKIRNSDGELERRVFTSCYDAASVHIYDPAQQRVEMVIRTGRGPHAIVIDEQHALAYIAQFVDSYVSIVDLDQSHTHSYGKIIANLGRAIPPRASK